MLPPAADGTRVANEAQQTASAVCVRACVCQGACSFPVVRGPAKLRAAMTCPCLRARHHERREKDGGFKGGGDKHTDTHRRALALNNFPLADRVRAAWAATGRRATRRDRPSPCRSQFCFVFGAFITHTRKKRHKRRQSHARHPMAATHAAPYSPHQQHDDFFGFFV